MDTPATTQEAPSPSNTTPLTIGIGVAVAVIAIVFAFSDSSWFAFSGNWYSLFKAIHVVVAVYWVGGGLLLMTLGLRAERSSDPVEIVTVARQAAFVGEKIFAPGGLVVLVMGIAMMINTNWGWSHFWVIFGLLGYAATFAVGLGVLSPLAKQVAQSAEQNGPTHPQTIALIDRILLVGRFDVAVLLVVILDMVTKPFA
jgi:uncharacterized membrane protein